MEVTRTGMFPDIQTAYILSIEDTDKWINVWFHITLLQKQKEG